MRTRLTPLCSQPDAGALYYYCTRTRKFTHGKRSTAAATVLVERDADQDELMMHESYDDMPAIRELYLRLYREQKLHQ